MLAYATERTDSSPLVLRRCSCGGIVGPSGECAACRAKRRARQAGPQLAPPIVRDVVGSAGRPLEPAVRGEMEAGLGHDFSCVRVHTDERAAGSARAIGALAYTVGRDIAFDSGRYAPASAEGRFVLAHELAHVIQQGHGSGGGTPSEVELERDADQAAAAVERGRARVTARTGPRLQRLCPPTPTSLGGTPPPESCQRAGAEIATGTRFDFCQDSTELLDGQELVLASTLDEARGATRVVIHGYASVEGPTTDYNYNLSCHRAAAMAARFRARGIAVSLVMHGPISVYPVASRNRAVIVQIDRPAAPPAPPAPSPQAQAASLADADCAAITRLHTAHRRDTIGLFLQIYKCLTCSFPAAIRGGTFEDPLWLANVNHFAITRLGAAFSSPNAEYQRAFSPCRTLDRCTSPDIGFFERMACEPIFESGTGMLTYIQMCTEGVGGVHLLVDLRDALRSAGCAAPVNKRDYARVIPLFQACNRAVLSDIPGGGVVAERIAIPRITEQRNAAWTNAGCP